MSVPVDIKTCGNRFHGRADSQTWINLQKFVRNRVGDHTARAELATFCHRRIELGTPDGQLLSLHEHALAKLPWVMLQAGCLLRTDSGLVIHYRREADRGRERLTKGASLIKSVSPGMLSESLLHKMFRERLGLSPDARLNLSPMGVAFTEIRVTLEDQSGTYDLRPAPAYFFLLYEGHLLDESSLSAGGFTGLDPAIGRFLPTEWKPSDFDGYIDQLLVEALQTGQDFLDYGNRAIRITPFDFDGLVFPDCRTTLGEIQQQLVGVTQVAKPFMSGLVGVAVKNLLSGLGIQIPEVAWEARLGMSGITGMDQSDLTERAAE